MVSNNDLMHIKCCAHILSLIVQDELKEFCGSTIKIQNVVKCVKSSPIRLAIFKSFTKQPNILGGGLFSLDVSTRWNSTYLILSVALKYYAVFEVIQYDNNEFCPYLCESGQGPLTNNDWKTIKVVL